MITWIDQLREIQKSGQFAISVAVASTRGSVPRQAGTRMLVTADEIFGTIGGGHLEFKAIEIARNLLTASGSSGGTSRGTSGSTSSGPLSLQRFPLGASLGQCCGGVVNLLFEPVAPEVGVNWPETIIAFQHQGRSCIAVTPVRGSSAPGKLLVTADEQWGSLGNNALDIAAANIATERLTNNPVSTVLTVLGEACFFEYIAAPNFHIVLFGAGHVARALIKILSELPCNITWVDSREEEFPAENYLGVERIVSDCPDEMVDKAAPGAWFLVMTHSHPLDLAICERILRRHDFAYFGLIGSLSKRRQFERRLIARGVGADRFAELICPIGSGNIASKEPMAIAISIAGELLQRRERMMNPVAQASKTMNENRR